MVSVNNNEGVSSDQSVGSGVVDTTDGSCQLSHDEEGKAVAHVKCHLGVEDHSVPVLPFVLLAGFSPVPRQAVINDLLVSVITIENEMRLKGRLAEINLAVEKFKTTLESIDHKRQSLHEKWVTQIVTSGTELMVGGFTFVSTGTSNKMLDKIRKGDGGIELSFGGQGTAQELASHFKTIQRYEAAGQPAGMKAEYDKANAAIQKLVKEKKIHQDDVNQALDSLRTQKGINVDQLARDVVARSQVRQEFTDLFTQLGQANDPKVEKSITADIHRLAKKYGIKKVHVQAALNDLNGGKAPDAVANDLINQHTVLGSVNTGKGKDTAVIEGRKETMTDLEKQNRMTKVQARLDLIRSFDQTGRAVVGGFRAVFETMAEEENIVAEERSADGELIGSYREQTVSFVGTVSGFLDAFINAEQTLTQSHLEAIRATAGNIGGS